jgi:hypothetical protein
LVGQYEIFGKITRRYILYRIIVGYNGRTNSGKYAIFDDNRYTKEVHFEVNMLKNASLQINKEWLRVREELLD